MGLINQGVEAMKLKVVHEGFQANTLPDPQELAAARALGKNWQGRIEDLGNSGRGEGPRPTDNPP